uniref:Putative secreted protein n=1 Tax=Amblyomma triste TaxID=251400 RepID=A0A023G3P7_AMBTT
MMRRIGKKVRRLQFLRLCKCVVLFFPSDCEDILPSLRCHVMCMNFVGSIYYSSQAFLSPHLGRDMATFFSVPLRDLERLRVDRF